MVAVIGDIHGCFHTLKELHQKIKRNYPEIEIYSVGDLVDRGKYSLESIEFIKRMGIKFTPGNHDLMFTHFFESPGSIFARTWIRNDHTPTLAAYEFEPDKVWEHIELINNQPLCYNLFDCFISHAGVSRFYKKDLPKNVKDDINLLEHIIDNEHYNEHGVMWNRDKLLDLGKLQVVGHTHSKEPYLDESANALYIDTGACRGNKLTAAIIEMSDVKDILFVETIEKDLY
ncbi:MAG: diadenosine tetraphosphatase [Ignavibacteriae bacterium]|nr:MAG: diadenosine tetraphosphatase [Ignavibacteriota bacterium]